MIIIGAKGHAKEVLDLLEKQEKSDNLFFFDNSSEEISDKLFGKFEILRSFDDVLKVFENDNRFILGIGAVKNRMKLYKIFTEMGGRAFSAISPNATIGKYNVVLGKGLNIMHHVSIFNEVTIGDGTLINSLVSIHHDSKIGEFCEISPGARILGRVTIGNYSSIGANAVILPDVIVGNNVVIGAGAVVTKNTEDNATYVGIPAVKII